MAQPVLVSPGEGESVSLRGSEVIFKVRSDQADGASVAEFVAAPGFDTGLHVHGELEETYYVLDGEFEFRLGDDVRRALPGSTVLVPSGVPHRFSNPTDRTSRALLMMSPGGHDRYFVELSVILAGSGPPDAAAIGALRAKYNTKQLSSLVAG